jgi:hypothetical protein
MRRSHLVITCKMEYLPRDLGEHEVILVALFRCKKCSCRVFEQDVHGHLERHGLTGINGDWRTYFVKGKRDTHSRPGANYSPMYKRSKQTKKA